MLWFMYCGSSAASTTEREASKPPAGTRFMTGRRPVKKASKYNAPTKLHSWITNFSRYMYLINEDNKRYHAKGHFCSFCFNAEKSNIETLDKSGL